MASEPQTVEVDGETYEYTAEKPWRDENLLEQLYWEKGMSQPDIAHQLDCSNQVVSRWMRKKEVPTVSRSEAATVPWVTLQTQRGYERWIEGVTQTSVAVHRLLAVAEYGFDAVIGNDVHHKNCIRFDNRGANIELRDPSDHRSEHGKQRTHSRDEHGNFTSSGASKGTHLGQ